MDYNMYGIKHNKFVLVKYRHSDEGTVGWFQMDIEDARNLWRHLNKRGLYWFCIVFDYEVLYFNKRYGWSNGVHLLKYC